MDVRVLFSGLHQMDVHLAGHQLCQVQHSLMSRFNFPQRSFAIVLAFLSAVLTFLFLIQVFASAAVEENSELKTEPEIWKTIFTDTFESALPAGWILTDTRRLANGEYFWAVTPVAASRGTYSLGVSGESQHGRELMPGLDQYPDNAASIMVKGPIIVGYFRELRLTLDVWIETKPLSDTLKLEISSDGVDFAPVEILSGSINQWQTISIGLNDTGESNQLWLKLSFLSNDSIGGGGVFIDNLKLEAKVENHLPIHLPVIRRGDEPTPVPGPGWLAYINQFRIASDLKPLTSNQDWSEGARLHSRYMVLNDYVGHYENPENQWYTPEGAAAAKSSNVFVTGWLDSPDENAINFWMIAPFHAVSILDPQLKETGFGSYREDAGYWQMAGSLDVVRGLDKLPEETVFPILYPADGGQIHLNKYYGGEFPDPLAGCPNYSPPTGSPIILQLGPGDLTPVVLSHSLESGGQILESCLYDETSYTNPNSGLQSSGRIILGNRDAVVIMPRYPLEHGKSYSVTVVTGEGPISWSFQTANSPGEFNNLGHYDQIVK